MRTPLDLTNLPDADVVALAKRGREPAFRELVRRYERGVFSVLFRMVQDRELAEDLAQDTFVKVFKGIDQYRPQFKFSSWVLRIAHNVAIDHVRKKHPEMRRLSGSPGAESEGDIESTTIDLMDTRASPHEVAEAGELGKTIEAAIRRLRPIYRSCVVLRFIEDKSYEEIATILDLPVGTVKTHIHRAREELKATLAAAR